VQKAYQCYLTATGGSLPVCEKLAKEVLSLPMSGYVTTIQIHNIIEEIKNFKLACV